MPKSKVVKIEQLSDAFCGFTLTGWTRRGRIYSNPDCIGASLFKEWPAEIKAPHLTFVRHMTGDNAGDNTPYPGTWASYEIKE